MALSVLMLDSSAIKTYACPYKLSRLRVSTRRGCLRRFLIMSHASLIVSTAKHAQVARALIQDIRSGKYPVGAQLPSEPELTVAFGVSRQTIRAALRNLRDLGLVQGEQGVGSFVLSNQPSTRYGYSFDSVDDLLQ